MSDDDFQYTAKDAVRHGGAVLTVGVVAIVVVLVLAAMYIFGWGFLAKTSAPWRGEAGKRGQVEGSGDYRVAAYDHFHDLCAQVQSDEASIRNLRREMTTAPKPSDERALQIKASITALENNRAENINQYNADAAKKYTQGQFRSSGLPSRLSLSTEETACTSSSPSPART
ncbi:hypothetical protein E1293_28710 [Actinomadura darangshiensis]|uniref:Uncharacterized protein n=1 Tax=Actinomadura darangshiensis TaxID=705336 RepID=A0A4R5ATC4_9ACTN|nr:hypothetical protein [Actinomadura darangshiensis]TDD75079.1 hypothetical protein E1293_28710 [Actinomadura darangshiensis]